jgi:threonine synthase
MNYISTRGNHAPVGSAEAILTGMVPEGGLFVPGKLPEIDIGPLIGKSYQDTAFEILRHFLCSDSNYSEGELTGYINKAYNGEKFDSGRVTPLHYLDENTAVLELWHGPTAAFKDIALQILPYFITGGRRILHREKEIVILVATSGDTGKAALEGFKNIPGTKIIVFYPEGGVSGIQEAQMLTTGGNNTHVIGIKGNFDDCQNIVKDIFADPSYNAALNKNGFELSSANSINWGRLAPQIVYYFRAYMEMIEHRKLMNGDKIDISVPTGNFGNILAAFYAREMGLPVSKLICASNMNNVLTDFINTGIYDKKREFYKTVSPSMDILISSNLERFLFAVSGGNPLKIVRWFDDLKSTGEFKVDDMTRQRIGSILFGDFATEEDTFDNIKDIFNRYGYLIDTHTSVGVKSLADYRKSLKTVNPAIICGTASPYKFNSSVYYALTGDSSVKDEFIIQKLLKDKTGASLPRPIEELEKLERAPRKVIAGERARDTIKSILSPERKVRLSLKKQD